MSQHICFIGDSHVAALRQALDDPRASAHGGRVTIYGSRGAGLFSLREEDGVLTTDIKRVKQEFNFTGGSRAIKLRKYDAFCIVGGLVKLERTDSIARSYATFGMAQAGRHLVSESLMRGMFEEVVRQTLAAHVLGLIAGTGKPVFYIPSPRFSEDIVGHEKGATLRATIADGLAEDYFGRFIAARNSVIGATAQIIEQPEETLAAPCFSKAAYGVGSVRLTKQRVEHENDDFNHMNQDYGVLMLNKAMETIDSALAAQA